MRKRGIEAYTLTDGVPGEALATKPCECSFTQFTLKIISFKKVVRAVIISYEAGLYATLAFRTLTYPRALALISAELVNVEVNHVT